MKLEERMQHLEVILSDVDGVLTDGGLLFNHEGCELKQFHVRDGLGIKLWQKAGFHFGLVTARTSNVVKLRAKELGISVLRQGHEEKLPIVKEILHDLGVAPEQACFIGDDLADLACLQYVGVGVTVSDGVPEVRAEADWVTEARGGHGAVRELIEKVLRTQQRWDDLIRRYYLPRRS